MRAQRGDGSLSGAWVKDLKTYTGVTTFPNAIPAGAAARIQFSNRITTLVNVQVAGQFRAQ